MFKSKMTQAQMKKIMDIGMESKDNMNALVAYGGDLYRQGIIKSAIVCNISYAAGKLIAKACVILKKKHDEKTKQKNEEES